MEGDRKIIVVRGDLDTPGSIVEFEGDYETNPITRMPMKLLRRFELVAVVGGKPQFKPLQRMIVD